jgi:hypothetical protein
MLLRRQESILFYLFHSIHIETILTIEQQKQKRPFTTIKTLEHV